MTSKIKVTPEKQEMLEREDPEIPLLDFSDAAVKQLIRSAKKRGYVTHDQINALLSVEEVKFEQVEDILAKFNEMGINVVETKEAEPEVGGDPRGVGGGRRKRAGRGPATSGSGQVRGQGTRRAHR